MKQDEKVKLEQMFRWAINKMFDEFPEINICWNEVRRCASNAWTIITDIDVK